METNNFEKGYLEKKSKLSEEEQKAEIAKNLEFKKHKESILARIEGEKHLQFLKSMIERGLITVDTAETLMSAEWVLDNEKIAEIFEKIDEIESTHDIDKLLPKEYRLTKDEYIQALQDDSFRLALLVRIDGALGFIYNTMHPHQFSLLDFFGGFMGALNKNLVRIQENTIDIKRSLIDKQV